MPFVASISFQNANSPLMEQLNFFHNHMMTILILIMTIVGYNLMSTMFNKNINMISIESQSLELFWTVVPTFILLLIGFPSIRLLYLLDEIYSPLVTLKSVGHQWYWSYEYSDFTNKEFDSYMISLEDTKDNMARLIEVDNRICLPYKAQIRNLVTSSDVLHSWTVPSMGIKVDAVPGRLNQLSFTMNRPGLFFGQCSEICGANHSFMPICIESINYKDFIKWTLISN